MAKGTCSIEGCEKPHRARGWCVTHYDRWLRLGDPLAAVRMQAPNTPADIRAKIISRVSVDASGCWLWPDKLDHGGYGNLHMRTRGKRRTVRAHRVAYEVFVGPIPDGLVIDHLCRVRHCVNPEHLEPVTQAENIRRGATGKWKSSQPCCINGHLYVKGSYRMRKGKWRECLLCLSERKRRFYAKPAA